MKNINYRFNEDKLIEEFKNYIDKTYSQHYVNGSKQTMDSIIEKGYGTGFCLGNIEKYHDRYGKKGETPDVWRKDLIKVMHYTLFQLFIHDKQYSNWTDSAADWNNLSKAQDEYFEHIGNITDHLDASIGGM